MSGGGAEASRETSGVPELGPEAAAEGAERKVALVTGSGRRRVGNQIVRALSDWGYAVAVHYHRSQEAAEETVGELRQRGGQALAVQADVADSDQVERMFDQVLDRFGRLDVLVTTASVWRRIPLEQVTADDVLRSFQVDTLGTFLCCRRGGLIMAGQETGGAIVTFGDWALARPYPGHAAYFAAKGCLPTLTRMFAVELAERNPRVRVNCIHPGPVMLPEGLDEAERQQRIESTLVKQADQPETVVQAVRFLIDNPFVTGVCLPVDGGRTIYAGP